MRITRGEKDEHIELLNMPCTISFIKINKNKLFKKISFVVKKTCISDLSIDLAEEQMRMELQSSAEQILLYHILQATTLNTDKHFLSKELHKVRGVYRNLVLI